MKAWAATIAAVALAASAAAAAQTDGRHAVASRSGRTMQRNPR